MGDAVIRGVKHGVPGILTGVAAGLDDLHTKLLRLVSGPWNLAIPATNAGVQHIMAATDLSCTRLVVPQQLTTDFC